MLQIKNLTITHNKDLRVILDNISFVLNPGDKAVIIGEEGNGKSTLLKWLYDPELVSGYADAEGERIISGEILAYLPQELPKEDADRSVSEFFSEDDLFWEKTPKELAEMAGRLSVEKEFYYREQPMRTLSGGERIKAQMLKLLLADPTVVLLDEPSNDLDIETLQWLEGWINGFKGSLLYISHDETLIERTANMVIHIEQLRRKTVPRFTVIHTDYRQYVSYRNSKMQNQEALAIAQRKEQKVKEEKIRRILQKVEHDQNAVSRQDPHGGRLLKKKMHAVKSLEHRYEREKQEAVELPDTEDAMYIRFDCRQSAVPSGKTVLDFHLDELSSPDGSYILSRDIHLNIRGSEKIAIIGRNGVGKSTLIRRIAEMLLSREDIKALYMPQDYSALLDENITPVEFLNSSGDKQEATRIRTYLGSMHYTADEMEHRISELSGGQKAKIILLKLSMSDANVLILDEPTRNFSPLSGPVIRSALRDFPGAIISVSHDRKYIGEVCDKVYRMQEDGLYPV